MIKLIVMIVLVLALVVIGPILTIWALNTLFPALAIPTTIETWAATVILGGLLSNGVKVTRG